MSETNTDGSVLRLYSFHAFSLPTAFSSRDVPTAVSLPFSCPSARRRTRGSLICHDNSIATS